jgi:Transglycosylase SLT domain
LRLSPTIIARCPDLAWQTTQLHAGWSAQELENDQFTAVFEHPVRPMRRVLARSVVTNPPSEPKMRIAALRCLQILLCIVTVLAVPVLSSSSAHARQALPATPRASSESLHPIAAFVREASRRFTVPEHWIRAVMRVESGAKSRARSRKGAMGLMQIMPKTWAELRARYGAPGFLAAYNAGPGRYERHLKTGRPLPAETQAFVAALAPVIESTRTSVRVAPVDRSFASSDSALFPKSILSTSRHGTLPADVRQSRASRTHPVVDLSALVPQSGNLFVRLSKQIRSP